MPETNETRAVFIVGDPAWDDVPLQVNRADLREEVKEALDEADRRTIKRCIVALDDTATKLHRGFDSRTLNWAIARLQKMLAEKDND
jgi:hypothetical protein